MKVLENYYYSAAGNGAIVIKKLNIIDPIEQERLKVSKLQYGKFMLD